MFENWSGLQKVAGVAVLGGAGYLIYRAVSPATPSYNLPSPLPVGVTPALPPAGPNYQGGFGTPSGAVVPTPMVQPVATATPGTQAYQVTTSATALNVRSSPSTSAPALGTVARGATVSGTGPLVIGPGSITGWLPVTIVLPSGTHQNGYVSMDYLTPITTSGSAQAAYTQTSTTAPQQPVGKYPLYKITTTDGKPAPVYDNNTGTSQNGTFDNGTLVYGTGNVAGPYTQLLDPTSASLIAGWVPTTSLTLQPAAISV